MIYGTGGVSFGEVKAEYSCPTCFHAPNAFDTLRGMRVGWTAGAGAAVLISPKWSAKVEYRRTSYETAGFSDPVTTASDSGNKLIFNQVTLGISYRFLPRRPASAEPSPIVPARGPDADADGPTAATQRLYRVLRFRPGRPHAGGSRRGRAARHRHSALSGYARIELNGYTDLAGTPEYNLKLSQRRATAVAEYLGSSRRAAPGDERDVARQAKPARSHRRWGARSA